MEDGLKFNYKLKCKIMEKFGTQNKFAEAIVFPRVICQLCCTWKNESYE